MYFDLRNTLQLRSKKNNLGLIIAAFAVIVGSVSVAPSVGANGSDMYTVIGEPELVLPDVPTMALLRVQGMPVMVRGTVRALNQVQVYVNTSLSDTIPLSLASTEFLYPLTVDEGVHTVRFLGVSSIPSSSTLDATFDVEYINDSPPTTTTPPPDPIQGSGSGGVTDDMLRPEIAETPGSLSPGVAIDSIGKIVADGMVTLDFAKPGDTSMTDDMLTRFAFITAGLLLIIIPQSPLRLYRVVRYRMLGWHRSPLPHFIRHYPLRSIRIAGALLILLVLWLP